MDQKYDDAMKQAATEAVMVRGESVLAVASRLKIPRSTLRGWLEPLRAAQRVMDETTAEERQAMKERLAHRWERVQHAHLDIIENSLDTLPSPETWKDHRDLIVSAGVSADKHFDYAEGRRGNAQVNIIPPSSAASILESLDADTLRALLALTPDERMRVLQIAADRGTQVVIEGQARLLEGNE